LAPKSAEELPDETKRQPTLFMHNYRCIDNRELSNQTIWQCCRSQKDNCRKFFSQQKATENARIKQQMRAKSAANLH